VIVAETISESVPLPAMQNRKDGYHQGIAPDTLPGSVYFERIVAKSINIHPVLRNQRNRERYACQRTKSAQISGIDDYPLFLNRKENYKNLQYVKEHFNYFSSKNLKIVSKYIAL
jgi:hypothetical protein